jgi:DNA-binding XRE family transcriptional regulator
MLFRRKPRKLLYRKSNWLRNAGTNILTGGKQMDDLDKYIASRKNNSPEFAKTFDRGYEQFKIGVILKQARLEAGLTQEQVAQKLHTQKSAISRVENHAEDIRLSTLVNYAQAVGRNLRLEVA